MNNHRTTFSSFTYKQTPEYLRHSYICCLHATLRVARNSVVKTDWNSWSVVQRSAAIWLYFWRYYGGLEREVAATACLHNGWERSHTSCLMCHYHRGSICKLTEAPQKVLDETKQARSIEKKYSLMFPFAASTECNEMFNPPTSVTIISTIPLNTI